MSCGRKIGPYKCCSVVQGDCLELMKQLPDGCVDALITDPPWGLGELSGTTSKARARNTYDSFEDTEDYVKCVAVPAVALALQKANGRGLVTPGCRCMFFYERPRSIGGFYQPAAVGMSPWGFAGYNPVLFYGKDPRDGKGQSSVMTTLTDIPEHNGHPCPKPDKAMLWMVAKGTVEGETIIDPFAGSGTTCIAAAKLGRHFLGFEISSAYCEIARKKIVEVEAQPTLFEPKPEQLTFGGER